MDLIADKLFSDRRLRALTVVDNCSRQALAIATQNRPNGEATVDVMNQIKDQDRRPKRIQVDNGSEFISKTLDKYAYEDDVQLDFSRPGEPADNPLIESFNSSFGHGCLNQHWFLSLDDARVKGSSPGARSIMILDLIVHCLE